MANSYTQTVFSLENALPSELAFLQECIEIAGEIEDSLEDGEYEAIYEAASDSFKAAFPRIEGDDDAFASFRSIFVDPDNTVFGGYLQKDGRFVGDEAPDITAIALLVQKTCPSLLPFVMEWSEITDKDVPSGFGGGFYVITANELIGGGTSYLAKQIVGGLKAEAQPYTVVFFVDAEYHVERFVEEVTAPDPMTAFDLAVAQARASGATSTGHSVRDHEWASATEIATFKGHNLIAR